MYKTILVRVLPQGKLAPLVKVLVGGALPKSELYQVYDTLEEVFSLV